MTNTEIAAANKIMLGTTEAVAMYIGSTLLWSVNSGLHDYSLDYFTIESLANNNSILMKKNNSTVNPTIYYSLDDGTTWNNLSITGNTTFATINTGDKIIFKANESVLATAWDHYNYFTASEDFIVYGNTMSLLYGDNFINNSEFDLNSTHNLAGLFESASHLIDASNLVLPALTCTSNCYNGMFRDCKNLTTSPKLPATLSAFSCYGSMFEGCINLEVAPEINLVNMSLESCMRMFCMNRSSKITTPKMTKSPILRCATGVKDCYREMFKGNGNLAEITCLLTTDHSGCCNNWITNACAASGIFYKASNVTWQGYTPTGWTIQDYVASS